MNLGLISDLIFPRVCLHCRKNLDENSKSWAVCKDCFSGIKINSSLCCGKCGLRLAENRKVCHKDFPYILGAAVSYSDEIVKDLIRGAKFEFIKDAVKPLADLLIRYLEGFPLRQRKFLVIPIPLGKRRERQREFNQSKLIAELFARHFGFDIDTTSLIRQKETKPQSELKGIEKRQANVAGCFKVGDNKKLKGKKIILIDDVTTSGVTFLEAASALKSAGARTIIALAVAKA